LEDSSDGRTFAKVGKLLKLILEPLPVIAAAAAAAAALLQQPFKDVVGACLTRTSRSFPLESLLLLLLLLRLFHSFHQAFKDVVRACLTKDPKARPSAGELLSH
jgi:hypothetical protein